MRSGESRSIPGLCSFPKLFSAPCVCPKGAFQPWKFVQQPMSLFSLPSIHCSRKRPRVTASPQGLHISPVSLGTLLPVIHTLSHAASPGPNSGLNSQEMDDLAQRWGWVEMSGRDRARIQINSKPFRKQELSSGRGVQPSGISASHWKKSCLGPHIKYIAARNHTHTQNLIMF